MLPGMVRGPQTSQQQAGWAGSAGEVQDASVGPAALTEGYSNF